MGVIQCSSALSTIGVSSCPCGPQGIQIPVSGQIEVGFTSSASSWNSQQRALVRNACCNATCEAFCSYQPAVCQEGGSMIQGITTPTSGIGRPPRPPKDVSRKRNASGMRRATGGRVSTYWGGLKIK